MSRQDFYTVLDSEVERIDDVATTKRKEKIIQSIESATVANIDNKKVIIFNSNDYLGLRFDKKIKSAEHKATIKYGTGPGAVRFISGTMQVHLELEKALAIFHQREAAMVFSSAFAANLATMFCLSSGQSKDSLVNKDVLVVSDALNHRSIIDGIRLANLPDQSKAVYEHLNMESLRQVLTANIGKVSRVVVVTDGVFSMLGEYQHLAEMRKIIDEFDSRYPLGVIMVVDDCHGIAACGATGRGVEELSGARADVLVGTLGKGFGTDGGYAVANTRIINYLRESSATYIYSNSITPGTAGAALAAVKIVDSPVGKKLLKKSAENTKYFKQLMVEAGLNFAADSSHPIQPVLIGESAKSKMIAAGLFEKNILVTNLSYPVVQKGRDEIRVQISAAHTREQIEYLVKAFEEYRD